MYPYPSKNERRVGMTSIPLTEEFRKFEVPVWASKGKGDGESGWQNWEENELVPGNKISKCHKDETTQKIKLQVKDIRGETIAAAAQRII